MIIIRIGLGITTPAGETVVSSRGWRSSETETSPMGFADQIELGPFRAAPNESVVVDTEYSGPSPGGASEFDDKKLPDTSTSPSRTSFLL